MSRDKAHVKNAKRVLSPLQITLHLCGWSLTAAGTALAIGGGAGVDLLTTSLDIQPVTELATHGLISGLVWYMVYSAWRAVSKPRAQRVLKAAHGTVITETLIVLLPFMLLTSGLAQMSINNMAGMLTNKAAYEAGRTMWVWEPTDAAKGQKRARLAAAASVAPVAPGSHFMMPNGDAELAAMRGVVYATFSPLGWIGGGSGISKTVAMGVSVGGKSGTTGRTFGDALDSDSFPNRAARKLNFAYEATAIEPIRGGQVGAKVTYKHFQAFPWFAWITGQQEFVGMRQGYYSKIIRTYTLPAQVR